MNALLIVLSLLDLALGAVHAWALTQIPPDRFVSTVTSPENLSDLIFTAAFFLAPLAAWLLRTRLPAIAAVAIAAAPFLLFVAMAKMTFNLTAVG